MNDRSKVRLPDYMRCVVCLDLSGRTTSPCVLSLCKTPPRSSVVHTRCVACCRKEVALIQSMCLSRFLPSVLFSHDSDSELLVSLLKSMLVARVSAWDWPGDVDDPSA